MGVLTLGDTSETRISIKQKVVELWQKYLMVQSFKISDIYTIHNLYMKYIFLRLICRIFLIPTNTSNLT